MKGEMNVLLLDLAAAARGFDEQGVMALCGLVGDHLCDDGDERGGVWFQGRSKRPYKTIDVRPHPLTPDGVQTVCVRIAWAEDAGWVRFDLIEGMGLGVFLHGWEAQFPGDWEVRDGRASQEKAGYSPQGGGG